MPFSLDKDRGLPIHTIDNGNGTCTPIFYAGGNLVNSVAVFGQAKLFGDVTLSASGAVQLQEMGNNIVIYAPTAGAGGGGVTSLNTETGDLTIAPSGAVQIGQSGTTITVYAPAAPAALSWEQEVLTGSSVGGNVVFILSHPPAASKAVIGSLGGVLQTQGTDYSMTGASASFSGLGASGQPFLAIYPY